MGELGDLLGQRQIGLVTNEISLNAASFPIVALVFAIVFVFLKDVKITTDQK